MITDFFQNECKSDFTFTGGKEFSNIWEEFTNYQKKFENFPPIFRKNKKIDEGRGVKKPGTLQD